MKLFLSIIFSFALMVGTGFALQAHAQVAGCTTTSGYNTATGMACNGSTVVPTGCTSQTGFSSATGMPCNGLAGSTNGYGGTTVGTNGYLSGCVSTSGYSATTGYPCNMAVNGVTYTGNGTTINTGLPTTTTTTTPTTTSPGLPTTGAGSNALVTVLVLIASGLVAFAGIRYSMREFSK